MYVRVLDNSQIKTVITMVQEAQMFTIDGKPEFIRVTDPDNSAVFTALKKDGNSWLCRFSSFYFPE